MGRIPRPTAAGIYHVTARSIAAERIFTGTEDFVDFVSALAAMPCRTHAFCVMPTHYHLLSSFDEGELPLVVQRLNRRYAGCFNRRHARRGHVFDSPYRSIAADSDEYLIWVTRYVAQNPTEPTRWPWSSFVSEYSFIDDAPLVDLFGSRDRMLRYVFETHEPGSSEMNQVQVGLRRP